ncbi:MAG: hypothetical protein MJ055_03915 [Phascolarctobacterium sp.]|nr:hypothetical protein [Phascolarctobacterium sp.]
MKKYLSVFLATLMLGVSVTCFAEKESNDATFSIGVKKEQTQQENTKSSIDVFDKGTADTGETRFEMIDKEVTECLLPYKVAVLPYVDLSGLENRAREMVAGAIKEQLKKKYPAKKNSKTQVVANNDLIKALKVTQFENPEAPTLTELVNVGEACGADRVIFISMLPVRHKKTGIMIIAGTSTQTAYVTMKLKCVDVNNEEYLFNQNLEGIGSSSSVNFVRMGEASPAKAAKRGAVNCMKTFLNSFE